MLSRHAEALFWLGRYSERASDITRMLEVAYNSQLERPTQAADEVWRDLLRALYLEEAFRERYGAEVTSELVNQFLVFDLENPASIYRSIREARNNVMTVRDLIPSELLEAINRLHTDLASAGWEHLVERPHAMYESLGMQSRMISGAVTESMSRNDEYRFLMLGRLLERAEMTCRMIDVNRSNSDVSSWMTVLRSVSGFHAFIRRYGPLAGGNEVIGFLLQEPTFPFSVRHCLRNAMDQLDNIGRSGAWGSPLALGRVSSLLEYADLGPTGSLVLGEFVGSIEEGIRTVGEKLHQDLFQSGGDPALYSFATI